MTNVRSHLCECIFIGTYPRTGITFSGYFSMSTSAIGSEKFPCWRTQIVLFCLSVCLSVWLTMFVCLLNAISGSACNKHHTRTRTRSNKFLVCHLVLQKLRTAFIFAFLLTPALVWIHFHVMFVRKESFWKYWTIHKAHPFSEGNRLSKTAVFVQFIAA